MNELIKKLEALGQSGSVKQSKLSQLLKSNDITESQAQAIIVKSQEHMCLLLPDDDED